MGRPERVLGPGGGALREFAAELRRVREAAGNPGYRQLAQRAHYSATTLSEAAGGRRLPSLAVTLAYVTACDGDAAAWEARWHAVSAELAASEADKTEAAPAGQAPYPGLAAFEADDADRFYGRERLVDDLVARLGRQRFLVVVGPSGAGKSSVLRAGLVARLRAGALARGAAWPVAVFTPGRRPVRECATALSGLVGRPAAELSTEVTADPDNLRLVVHQGLADRPDDELVIVVDQFEEVYTLCDDPTERAVFVAALLAAAESERGRARVVLGVRADFYGACLSDPRLVEVFRDGQVPVGPMAAEDLRRAITGPAARAGCTVEGALLARLLADAAGQPGVLPLMSHALLETWRRRRGNALTLTGYSDAGGIGGALAQTAESTYAGFSPAQQALARQIFLRLTAPGDGTQDTRQPLPRARLDAGPDTDVVLEALVRARLVTLDDDTVAMTHEALIGAWQRLRDWLDADRAGLRLHRQLTTAAHGWQALDRDPGALYRGTRLVAADELAQRDDALLSAAEREFLEASLRAERHERKASRRRSRQLRSLLAGLCVLLAVSAGAAVVAVKQRDRAEAQRTRAEAERALAASSQLVAKARRQLDIDPELALLLARRAYQLMPGAETQAMLRQATANSRINAVLPEIPGQVSGVAFSPDGQQVAVADGTPTVRLWSWVRGGVKTIAAQVPAKAVAFRPNGPQLAALGWQKGKPSGMTVTTLTGPTTGPVIPGAVGEWQTVDWVAGRPRAVTAGADGLVTVWGPGAGDLAGPHLAGEATVLAAAAGPRGRSLVAVGDDNRVHTWSVAGRRGPVREGRGKLRRVTGFSPDGKWVFTGDIDGIGRLWPLAGWGDPVGFTGPKAMIMSVAFSPDGRRMATGTNNNTVLVWNIASPGSPIVLRGHTGAVQALAFSRNGRYLVSGGADHTVRVWDVAGRVAPQVVPLVKTSTPWAIGAGAGHVAAAEDDGTIRVSGTGSRPDLVTFAGGPDGVLHLALSADGRRAAAVDSAGDVQVWRAPGDARPDKLSCPDNRGRLAGDVAMSPDGGRVAADCGDSYVEVWPLANVDNPARLEGVTRPLQFSPDGRRLATTDARNGDIVIWDLASPGARKVLHRQRTTFSHLAFSPDGTRLAGAGDDATIRIWSTTGGGVPAVLRGHTGPVTFVAFSSDGQYLASLGDDTLRIWTGTAELTQFGPFGGKYVAVAFQPEPGRLVTTHDDGVVQIWPCEVCDPVAKVLERADERVTRQLAPEELGTY